MSFKLHILVVVIQHPQFVEFGIGEKALFLCYRRDVSKDYRDVNVPKVRDVRDVKDVIRDVIRSYLYSYPILT